MLGSDSSSAANGSARRVAKAAPRGWLAGLLAPISAAGHDDHHEVFPRGRRRGAADDPRRRKRAETSTSPPPPQKDPDADALVYVFPVSATDTLERVVLVFDTTAAAVRRANGLWPGDSIQARKELVVPVEGCGVKGLPLPEDPAAVADHPPPTPSIDRDYKPMHRVHIPNLGPTTLARMPNRKLGFFPARRRIAHPQRASSAPSATADDEPPPTPLHFGDPGIRPLHPETHPQTADGLGRTLWGAAAEVEGYVRRFTARVGVASEGMIELTTRLVDGDEGEGVELVTRKGDRGAMPLGGGIDAAVWDLAPVATTTSAGASAVSDSPRRRQTKGKKAVNGNTHISSESICIGGVGGERSKNI